jgi:uncharacterized membrane protein SirB2
MTTFILVVHVAISLAGIGSGFVVLFEMIAGKRLDGWTALFLATTVATSVTGFGLPADHFMASHAIGIVSLVVLAIAIYARYARHLAGAWRWIYVVSAVVAQYFDVFVLIAQAFMKVPALKAIAPTQSEPPFLIAQLVVMAIFIALGVVAVKRYRSAPLGPS